MEVSILEVSALRTKLLTDGKRRGEDIQDTVSIQKEKQGAHVTLQRHHLPTGSPGGISQTNLLIPPECSKSSLASYSLGKPLKAFRSISLALVVCSELRCQAS